MVFFFLIFLLCSFHSCRRQAVHFICDSKKKVLEILKGKLENWLQVALLRGLRVTFGIFSFDFLVQNLAFDFGKLCFLDSATARPTIDKTTKE